MLNTSPYFKQLNDDQKAQFFRQSANILDYIHGAISEDEVEIERILLKNLEHEVIRKGIQKFLHFRGLYRRWLFSEPRVEGLCE